MPVETKHSTDMFTIQTLTDSAKLARFATAYEAASRGVNISHDYLRRVRHVQVASLSDHPDVFLGGYTVNNEPPLRYFIAPGEAARHEALAPLGLHEEDLVEIGSIWFSEYNSPFRSVHRVRLFHAMLRDALQTDKPYILGGSFIPQVQAIQRIVLPNLIYEQRITVGTYTGNLQLYVGPRKGIWRRFVKALLVDGFRRAVKAVTGGKRQSPRVQPAMP